MAQSEVLIFYPRPSRRFYFFWAAIFAVYMVLDFGKVLSDATSNYLLIIIVGYAIGSYGLIAFQKYRCTKDYFFVNGPMENKKYHWENLIHYEIQSITILRQLLTAEPANTIALYFNPSGKGKRQQTVYSSDPSFIQFLQSKTQNSDAI